MVSISDTICSTVISDDGHLAPRVYYFDGNSHVREMVYANEKWRNRDITQDSGSSSHLAAPGSPLCCTTAKENDDQVPRIYYFDRQHHVWELAYAGKKWHNTDVTNASGSSGRLAAPGSPLCCTTTTGTAIRIYYLDRNAHICEIAYTSVGWQGRDITQDSGTSGQAHSNTPLCCTTIRRDGHREPRIYYFDRQHHVWELAYAGEKWRSRDVTKDSGTWSIIAADSPLCCTVVSEDDDRFPRIYYFDRQHHIWELAYAGKKWRNTDVTLDSDTSSVVAPDSSLCCNGVVEGERVVPRVYYVDNHSRVHELAYINRKWQHGDITAVSKSPALAANSSPLSCTTVVNNAIRIYHFDSHSQVWELALTSKGWKSKNLILGDLRITVRNIDVDKINFHTLTDKNVLLDVWGEGRINDQGLITGFDRAFNLNDRNQTISNGSDRGKLISNLVPVYDYNNPEFPIDDGLVSFITLMGAPITEGTAKEMYRVLNKSWGVVILYDPSNQHRADFEKHKGNLVLKTNSTLGKPFDEVTITSAYVYGFPGAPNHDEL